MSQEAWWSTGYEEMEDLPERPDQDRFYLKSDQEALLIFLDGDEDDRGRFDRPYGAPFCIWEYQIPTKGPEDQYINWRNWATCVRGRKGPDGESMTDHVREAAPDLKPYYVGFFSVVTIPRDVDLDYHIREKVPLPDSCKTILLPAKRKLLGVLKRHMNKRDGLRGCIYNVFRGSSKAASTGDDWQFDEKLDEETLKALLPDGDDVPLAYPEVLEPLSKEEVEHLVSIRTKVNSYDDNDGSRGRRGRGRGGDDQGSRRGRGRDRGRGRGRGRSRSRQDDYDDMYDDVPF